MKTGPQIGAGANGDARSFVEKAIDCWTMVPEWVEELAKLADAEGLKGAGERIGYSGSAVSQVINNKYGNGDLGRVEEKVAGALMGAVVWCQGVGDDVPRHTCLDWQKKPFVASSPDRARMFRACRNNCPNFRSPPVGNRAAATVSEGVSDAEK